MASSRGHGTDFVPLGTRLDQMEPTAGILSSSSRSELAICSNPAIFTMNDESCGGKVSEKAKKAGSEVETRAKGGEKQQGAVEESPRAAQSELRRTFLSGNGNCEQNMQMRTEFFASGSNEDFTTEEDCEAPLLGSRAKR